MAVVRRKSGSPLVVASKLSGTLVDDIIKANDPNLDFFQIEVDTTLPGATASDQFACWNWQASAAQICDIGWGDGTFTVSSTGDGEIHTYATSGAYKVRCIGNQRWRWISGSPYADQPKVTQINRFGYYNGCAFLYNSFYTASIDGPLLSIDTPNPNKSHILTDFLAASGITSIPASLTLQGLTKDVDGFFSENPNFDDDVGNITGTLVNVTDLFKNCTNFNNNGSTSINNLNVVTTGMNEVFSFARNFNQPVGNWDVSAAQNFAQTFYEADAFNQDLSGWNVGNANTMSQMFRDANAWTGIGIGGWNVAKVTSFGFFAYNTSINVDISSWDVGLNTSFGGAFRSTPFNNGGVGGIGVGLDTWNVSRVTDFGGMLESTPFNHPLTSWTLKPSTVASTNTGVGTNQLIDTSVNFTTLGVVNNMKARNEVTGDVATVTGVTATTLTLNQDIFPSSGVSYEVFSGIIMSSMFRYNTAFNGEISGWDVKNVTSLDGFCHSNSSTANFNNGGVNTGAGVGLDTWRFKHPLSCNQTFANQPNFNCYINNWNWSQVTNFTQIHFENRSYNQPINNYDFSNATLAPRAFRYCNVFNQPFNGGTGWGSTTSGLTDLSYAFANCPVLNQPWTGDLSSLQNWNGFISSNISFNGGQAPGIRSRDVRFILPSFPSGGGNLTGGSWGYAATAWAQDMESDGTYWDVSGVTNWSAAFFNTKVNQDLSSWSLKSITNLSTLFGTGAGPTFSFYNICKTLPGWVSNVPNTGCNASTIFNNRIISKTATESTVTTGTATSVSTLKLVDTGVDFVTLGVSVGDRVNNTTTGEYAEIKVVAATELDLDFDAFLATDNYEIITGYDAAAGYEAYNKLAAPTPASYTLSGTNTSTNTSELIDTGTDFVTSGVLTGMVVKNTTAGTSSVVSSVATNTLTLADDIFTATPENYTIEGGYGWVLTSGLNWT